jgi:hypothetical protein
VIALVVVDRFGLGIVTGKEDDFEFLSGTDELFVEDLESNGLLREDDSN